MEHRLLKLIIKSYGVDEHLKKHTDILDIYSYYNQKLHICYNKNYNIENINNDSGVAIRTYTQSGDINFLLSKGLYENLYNDAYTQSSETIIKFDKFNYSFKKRDVKCQDYNFKIPCDIIRFKKNSYNTINNSNFAHLKLH
jgi:hypothetical protein